MLSCILLLSRFAAVVVACSILCNSSLIFAQNLHPCLLANGGNRQLHPTCSNCKRR
jgi:hypothetical protein